MLRKDKDRVSICSHCYCHCSPSVRLCCLLILVITAVIFIQLYIIEDKNHSMSITLISTHIPQSWYQRYYSTFLNHDMETTTATTIATDIDNDPTSYHIYSIQDREEQLTKIQQQCMGPSWNAISSMNKILPHTIPSRPFHALDTQCSLISSLSQHQLAVLEYQILLHDMQLDEDEMNHYDLLDDYPRDEANDSNRDRYSWLGGAIPYNNPPSQLIYFASFDHGRELDPHTKRLHTGGECELIRLGGGMFAHEQPLYVATPGVLIKDQNISLAEHNYFMTTTLVKNELHKCTPTSTQIGQAQTYIHLMMSVSPNQMNCPQPVYNDISDVTVTYLLSRHNSANPWHVLIEHMYPQWVQMFLRGDFPLKFNDIIEYRPSHYTMIVFHETGGPNSPVFDSWWYTVFGVPITYLAPPTPIQDSRVCCELCIFGPPKTLSVYDFWDGGRFVYNTHTQVMIRMYRRFVFARLNISMHKHNIIFPYSFQITQNIGSQYTTFKQWMPLVKNTSINAIPAYYADDLYSYSYRSRTIRRMLPWRIRPSYQLPDFPNLVNLAVQCRARSLNITSNQVTLKELNPNFEWNYRQLIDKQRTILISPTPSISYDTIYNNNNSNNHHHHNTSYDSLHIDSPLLLTSLPLVVFTRRPVNSERAIKPHQQWLDFYSQQHIRDNLSYHLLLLFLEDLPWKDQIILMSRASMLLTTEGASEINILYLPLRSVVIEIECKERLNDGFRPRPWHQSLSQYLGHLHIHYHLNDDCWLDHTAMNRLHETITQSLASKERNKYIYMS